MAVEMIIFSAIVLFLIVFLYYLLSIYNGFITLRTNIQKAWANIDVLLKQRFDELPNLVETVKGYAKHEKQTLENITKLRSAVQDAGSIHDKAIASEQLSQNLKTLFAVAENYPNLKANENFLKLQKRITELENLIADRREFYNDSVNLYNIKIASFPDLIISRMFNFKLAEFFSAQANEREAQMVKF
ncbi:LemA family protein [Candidatus Micrarchaeota archaeon]|nr:LemA family protein [Candidatus Micrarchaeota archaeon]